MKKYAIMAALLLLAMALCPLAATGAKKENSSPVRASAVPVISYDSRNETEYITVMLSATGSTEKIEMREYIIGCVAAEMSAGCHPEALKAQAVASYTYAKRITENSSDYISDSPLSHQGYVCKEERMEKWGENFEENEKKIADAVDEVFGKSITCNGETVLAVYHSISAGQTRSAKSIWGSDYPYLQSVASPGDKLSPDFSETKSFSAEEFAQMLGVEAEGSTADWVGDISESGGYVETAVICGREFSGEEIREALNLRSSSFEIEAQGSKITVTCRGYGHGVGMSQYGADYMARQGSTWQEIIGHYYPDTEIKSAISE